MSKIAMLAKLTAIEGRRDELVAVLEKIFDQVETEAGTLVYALHTDNADANAVWFYELYADQAGLDAHSKSDAMAEMFTGVAGLVGAPPEMHMLTPQRAKGIDVS